MKFLRFHPPSAVFFGVLAVYMANGRPHPEIDCVAAPYTAWSIVRHGTFDVGMYPELAKYRNVGLHFQETPDGLWVSQRTPGSAIASAPVFAPFAAFRDKPFRDLDMNHLGKLTSALCLSFAAMFFYLACRNVAPQAAWPATILFTLGTCNWSVASQALWVHGPAVMGLSAALWLLMKDEELRSLTLPARSVSGWRSFLIGLSLGFATLCRPTAGVFPAVTVATLVLQRRWREAFFTCLGGLLPAVVLLRYHYVYFGNLLVGGYAGDNLTTSPPLWIGFGGLLVAPSRGLFVYSPALVLIFPGVWLLVRNGFVKTPPPGPLPEAERGSGKIPMLLAWLAAALVTLWIFARWYDWRGGWCYGPRFSCEVLPILCLTFAYAYQQLKRRWARIAACVLVGLSVAVQAVGIFGYSAYEDWQRRHDPELRQDDGRCLFELHDTQIEAHARGLVKKVTGRKD